MKAPCENSTHDGDRLVDRRDLVEKRIEWRDLTSQGRWKVKVIRRECKSCATRDIFGDVWIEQGSML